ncbi:bifunctional riboflavin kinase/FAD synthetase [Plasticicumulans acidivorans]|uniref:Riboflavin biosynthesis protein n=1 Tax=Plasticicumulans acidivorans TaxID=886464 RepID=A0A317MS61_9GAMM|nr:bifunctional riboflavin kinase/FAD synthetase [Plasticicumulans acidivorans]PWV59307.1 riboflavin kinase/FMN adenylyltransferase [Plasticicumulans acidivorans]
MELIRGTHNLRPRHHGCVATIGNFDGVHLGHRAVLAQLRARGAALSLPVLVMTFEPYPQEFFARDNPPPRLSRLREKLSGLAAAGVDRVLVLRFDERLAQMDPEAFVDELLVRQLGVRHLVVGDDFRFGRGRAGDFALLERCGRRHGFEVVHTPTFELEGGRVSSTRIRELLARGELDAAAALLGRPYAVQGRVAHGAKLGRTIGFPTANVHLHRRSTSLDGVYAVTLQTADGRRFDGVANLGRRPTVGGTREQLEVHLFEFCGDLYGRAVSVEFRKHLRAEQRFASLDALTAQIERDAQAARAYFRALSAS